MFKNGKKRGKNGGWSSIRAERGRWQRQLDRDRAQVLHEILVAVLIVVCFWALFVALDRAVSYAWADEKCPVSCQPVGLRDKAPVSDTINAGLGSFPISILPEPIGLAPRLWCPVFARWGGTGPFGRGVDIPVFKPALNMS